EEADKIERYHRPSFGAIAPTYQPPLKRDVLETKDVREKQISSNFDFH
ncbi:MAG: hypothetical protein ACI87E_004529, partial [Mariniblastus sp.]